MRKLSVFETISVDGYFTDAQGNMNWAHTSDPEMDEFTSENARGGGELVFGRVTYELMASYWPTPEAHAAMPDVAQSMNGSPKIVFSRTLDRASWDNTELIRDNVVEAIQRKKQQSGPDMVILGSGTIVAQLTRGAARRRVSARRVPDRARKRQNAVRWRRRLALAVHEHTRVQEGKRHDVVPTGLRRCTPRESALPTRAG